MTKPQWTPWEIIDAINRMPRKLLGGIDPDAVKDLLQSVADQVAEQTETIDTLRAENSHIKGNLSSWQTNQARQWDANSYQQEPGTAEYPAVTRPYYPPNQRHRW